MIGTDFVCCACVFAVEGFLEWIYAVGEKRHGIKMRFFCTARAIIFLQPKKWSVSTFVFSFVGCGAVRRATTAMGNAMQATSFG